MQGTWELWGRVALIGSLLASICWLTGCKRERPSAAPQAVPVVAAEIVTCDATNFFEVIAQTYGSQDVEIRARVAGFLKTIDYNAGTLVRSNDLLFTIDDEPLKAALDQALAILAQAEATWGKSRRDTNRFGPLWVKGAISGQQYDDSLAAERSAAANVLAATAAATNAAIQLSYARICSPTEGIVGKAEVSVGNVVGQGQTTLLTTVSKVNPIRARFSVSEQAYLDWRRHLASHQAEAASIFRMVLSDGTEHPERGSLVYGDREVDPRTGTFLLEVEFPNPSRILRPGQFARLRFPVGLHRNAILVPQRAVQELQAVRSVFTVTADNKAEFRRVELGGRIGTHFLVTSGLKAGDRLVLDGIQKLQNQTPVAVTLTNLFLAAR